MYLIESVLEFIMDLVRINKNTSSHISIQKIIEENEIDFDHSTSKIIGTRVVLDQYDLSICKSDIQRLDYDVLKRKEKFKGDSDYIFIYSSRNFSSNKKLILAIVDPVELFDNPYLLSHKLT